MCVYVSINLFIFSCSLSSFHCYYNGEYTIIRYGKFLGVMWLTISNDVEYTYLKSYNIISKKYTADCHFTWIIIVTKVNEFFSEKKIFFFHVKIIQLFIMEKLVVPKLWLRKKDENINYFTFLFIPILVWRIFNVNFQIKDSFQSSTSHTQKNLLFTFAIILQASCVGLFLPLFSNTDNDDV